MSLQTEKLDSTSILWYDRPACYWTEALPLGNGRIGAMVFGGVPNERLQFNEELFWSGYPREQANPSAPAYLPLVRQAVFAGDYALADELVRKMQGPFTQSYLPFGDLFIEMDHACDYENYRRWLDLDTATHHTEYTLGDVRFTRQAFISAPANVLVLRLTCSQRGGLNFRVRLDGSILPHSPLQSQVQASSGQLLLTGKAPQQDDPHYLNTEVPFRKEFSIVYGGEGMTCAARLGAAVQEGRITSEGDALRIEGADQAVLILSAATSFNGFDRSPVTEGKDPLALTAQALAAALPRPFDPEVPEVPEVPEEPEVLFRIFQHLLQEHLAEYQPTFRRVSLQLGALDAEGNHTLPTDRRIAAFQQTHDLALVTLLFQYGRYLLIASSRPHTLPANLQGIWNDLLQPPWSSNYTININTQMNYWPAESANLAECATALFDFLQGLSVNGAKIARVNYAAHGWCSHHNSDVWHHAAPVGNYGGGSPHWANFPLSGAWLCTHLWEHYAFGGDLDFLREVAYPLMKGAAEFCLDWLVEGPTGLPGHMPGDLCREHFCDRNRFGGPNQPGDHLRHGHHRPTLRELHRGCHHLRNRR